MARKPITADDLQSRLTEALRFYFTESGLSQRAVERKLSLGHGTLSNYLCGRTEIRFALLERLGTVLGFSLSDILLDEILGRRRSPRSVRLPTAEERFAQVVADKVVQALAARPGAVALELRSLSDR